MKFLQDMANVASRVAGVNGNISAHGAFNRLPGASNAASRIESVVGTMRAPTDQVSYSNAGYVEDVAPREVPSQTRESVEETPRKPDGPRHGALLQSNVLRPGRSEARWDNPIIDIGMPVLLRLSDLRAAGRLHESDARAQLSLEVRMFRDRLGRAGVGPRAAQDSCYLLCSYIDEVVNDVSREAGVPPYAGEPSLLVEFHGDAWGGEDAFANLERWMSEKPLDLAVLEFYELILSLGWQGRYRVMERGTVLLGDLRARLHALIWHQRQLGALGAPTTEVISPARRAWFGPGRFAALCLLLLGGLYAWLVLDLDARGRPIRQALAAWDPPIRTINLAETLPPPLPRLLSEGWVTAQKVPEGWRLIFKSDGAFAVGQANFKPEFLPQIDRLGAAFAPWPGDMEVVGHSDIQPMRGNKQFADNTALSLERARVVASELEQTAVANGSRAAADALPRRITFSGRGEKEPVDPARTAAAYERNRRVEILWLVKDLEPQKPRAVQR